MKSEAYAAAAELRDKLQTLQAQDPKVLAAQLRSELPALVRRV